MSPTVDGQYLLQNRAQHCLPMGKTCNDTAQARDTNKPSALSSTEASVRTNPAQSEPHAGEARYVQSSGRHAQADMAH